MAHWLFFLLWFEPQKCTAENEASFQTL